MKWHMHNTQKGLIQPSLVVKKKSIDEPCTLKPGYTWHKWSIRKRIYLLREKVDGRPAWHYVLVINDQDTIDKFKEELALDSFDVANHGQVLNSGWGEEPLNDAKEWADNYEKT